MGRLSETRLCGWDDHKIIKKPRIGLILGTGWSNPDVLREQGFELEEAFEFVKFGCHAYSGAGHPNKFLFGTWHGKDVVISQGRVHLYQECQQKEFSLIRRWMSTLLNFMGGSNQLVITSAVGGLSERMKEDMIVMPTGIVSTHLPMPYLEGRESEFVMSEHLLWYGAPGEQAAAKKASEQLNCVNLSRAFMSAVIRRVVFVDAMEQIGQPENEADACVTHYVVPGPGFGGATERRLWASWGCDTVGMSLDPELRLVALENLDNRPEGIVGMYHETDIRVFPLLFVSDAHDLPNNDEIIARAKAMAPKFGKVLSCIVQSRW